MFNDFAEPVNWNDLKIFWHLAFVSFLSSFGHISSGNRKIKRQIRKFQNRSMAMFLFKQCLKKQWFKQISSLTKLIIKIQFKKIPKWSKSSSEIDWWPCSCLKCFWTNKKANSSSCIIKHFLRNIIYYKIKDLIASNSPLIKL